MSMLWLVGWLALALVESSLHRPVPLAVASRATLLDLLRYVVSLDIILAYGYGFNWRREGRVINVTLVLGRAAAAAVRIALQCITLQDRLRSQPQHNHPHHVASSWHHPARLQRTTQFSHKNMRRNDRLDLRPLPRHRQRLPSRPHLDFHADALHRLLGSSAPLAPRQPRLLGIPLAPRSRRGCTFRARL